MGGHSIEGGAGLERLTPTRPGRALSVVLVKPAQGFKQKSETAGFAF